MEDGKRDGDFWATLAEPIRRFAARRVRDSHAAEDLAQDVMVKVRSALASAPGSADGLAAWMFRIARNTVADYYRSPRSRGYVPLEAAGEPAATDDDAGAICGLAACLRPMVAKLPEPYREALELTEFGGVSQVELAARLGISVSGAKSRVQRGRERLKAMLLDCCRIEVGRGGGVTGCERTARSDEYCGGADRGAGV
jgi:RNA polymerase sigma-70 factor (ECF subfamily)